MNKERKKQYKEFLEIKFKSEDNVKKDYINNISLNQQNNDENIENF